MGRDLAGKVALVTGAARGQGRSHALALAHAGADVIAVDLCAGVDTVPYPPSTPEDLAGTVARVERTGRRIVASATDIRDLAALRAAVGAGVAELGRLDIVVANAGISGFEPLVGMDEATWDDMVEVNLTGQWKTVSAAVPHIVATGDGGSIVLVSSNAALRPFRNLGHYSAAKAGLTGLMKVLALELAPERIRVNTIHPANVHTDMIHNDFIYRLFRPELEDPTRADFEEVARSKSPLDIPAVDPEDISRGVLYLVSESGRYVTGTALVVDAGGLL